MLDATKLAKEVVISLLSRLGLVMPTGYGCSPFAVPHSPGYVDTHSLFKSGFFGACVLSPFSQFSRHVPRLVGMQFALLTLQLGHHKPAKRCSSECCVPPELLLSLFLFYFCFIRAPDIGLRVRRRPLCVVPSFFFSFFCSSVVSRSHPPFVRAPPPSCVADCRHCCAVGAEGHRPLPRGRGAAGGGGGALPEGHEHGEHQKPGGFEGDARVLSGGRRRRCPLCLLGEGGAIGE